MRKGYKEMTYTKRIELETLLKAGYSVIEAARMLNVCEKTVYNELHRGKYTHTKSDLTTQTRYSAQIAQEKRDYNVSARGTIPKVLKDKKLAKAIEEKIVDKGYSPENVNCKAQFVDIRLFQFYNLINIFQKRYVYMTPLELAEEIINGRRIKRQDDLTFFLNCDLDELCEGADRIRKHFVGDKVDLCSIINGRSGKCPEDCKYCAQSAHNHTDCEVYDFLPEEDIVKACKLNESEGVDRFSIVTAGKALSGEEFEKAVHAYETMNKECDIELCASMGFLNAEQLHRLHEAGVTSYHHNIETSRRNFPNICTTHTYDMKIETLKLVKAEGMWACSGGIIGMGEDWEDRLDMAISLAEVGVDSIPLNALMPIKGTPLENERRLTEPEILRTIAFFRYINPEADIRLGAGRALLTGDGIKAFQSGASATITGNMLTTVACATIRSDKNMLKEIGRETK